MRRTLEELRERRREAYEKLRAEQQAETIARQEQDRLNTDPLHGTVPTGILAERDVLGQIQFFSRLLDHGYGTGSVCGSGWQPMLLPL